MKWTFEDEELWYTLSWETINTTHENQEEKTKVNRKKGRLGHHHYHHWLILNHITMIFVCSLFCFFLIPSSLKLWKKKKSVQSKFNAYHMIKKKMLCFLYPNCTSYAEDTLPSKSCYYLRKKLESPFFSYFPIFLYRYTPKGVSFWILRKT